MNTRFRSRDGGSRSIGSLGRFRWIPLILLVLGSLSGGRLWAQQLIRGPYLQLGRMDGRTGMAVSWFTDRAASSAVDIIDSQGVTRRFEAGGLVTHHVVEVDGLEPGAAYQYRVYSGGRALFAGGEFQTFRDDDSSLVFTAFGDSGTGQVGQYDIGARVTAENPAFGLITGDVVYSNGEDQDYDAKFFRPYEALMLRTPLLATIGNHDAQTQEGAPLLENFVLPEGIQDDSLIRPEENYSFEAGNVHVAVVNSSRLDGYEADFQRIVLPWLRRDLLASTKPWKIMMWHYPPYSDDTLHGDDSRVQQLLVPLLEEMGVQFGFFGHSHNYQRFKPMKGGEPVSGSEPGAVVYVVTGAGGADLYPIKPSSRLAASYENDFSFSLVHVNGREFRLRQIDREGKKVDDVRFHQSAVEQTQFGLQGDGAAFYHLERTGFEYGYPVFLDGTQAGIGGLGWIRYRPQQQLGSSIPIGTQRAKRSQWVFVEWAHPIVTSLAVTNPNTSSTTISLTAYSEKGAVMAVSQRNLGPRAQLTESVPSLLPGLRTPFTGSVLVSATQAVGVVSVRSLLTEKGVRLASVAPFSAGDNPEALVFFPTDPAFASRVILMNSESEVVTGRLAFKREGEEWSQAYSVPSKGFQEIRSTVVKEKGNWWVEAIPQHGRVPKILGIWRVVRAPGDYFEAVLNGRESSSQWRYPVEETAEQKLSFAVVNPQASPASVQMVLRDASGRIVEQRRVELGGGEIQGFYLRDFFAAVGTLFRGSLELRSSANFLAEGFLTSLEPEAFTVAAFPPLESGGKGMRLLYPFTVFDPTLFQTNLWIQNRQGEWLENGLVFRAPTGKSMALYQRY